MDIPSNVFQNTVLYSSFGIAILGNSGVIRMANKSLQSMFGCKPGELEGRSLAEFFMPDGQEEFFRELEAIRSGVKSTSSIELAYSRTEGEERWCKLNIHLVPHPEKESWILTACIEDVTDQYKLIKELTMASRVAERARDEAELATKTKSEFLANTSHEIRTPIHTIIGMTELMLDTALDPEQQEYAEQVQFSADVLLSLINDILDFEKIEAGKLKLESIEMSLFEILENAMDLVVLEGHRKGLEMILDIGADVPNMVSGDPVRLRQILVNLVNNAIKFTASGEIHLAVHLAESSNELVELKFTVRDTGIGISDEKKNKLFKEFSQVDSSTTRKYGGTGLGLSISKKLSEMMNGKIGVESVEGDGSTFWFTAKFPVLPDDDRFLARGRFPDHRILIADDNETCRGVLKRHLEFWGCDVTTAASGDEALKTLLNAKRDGLPFHSCFVDLVMPRMDGWHFANEVKTNEELKKTVLYLLSPTGRGTIEPKMKLLNWFSGYLDKPVKLGKLFLAYCRDWEEGVANMLAATMKASGDDDLLLSRGNILVAEDHEVNQQLFKAILENQGQAVTIANNGLEAVKAVEKEDFDIIFMDVQMPEMNGYEATIKIRELGSCTPIIAVTASAIRGEKEKCLSVGMTDFLTKPFKKKDIIPVLHMYLEAEATCLEELESLDEAELESLESPQELEALDEVELESLESPQELEALDEVELESLESPQELEALDKTELETTAEAVQNPEIEEAFHDDVPTSSEVPDFDDLSEALSTDPIEIFDYDEALDTFMGKEEIVLKLLRSQVEKIRGQIPVMEEALAASEWETLRESAHAIKGGSWNLQAKQIGDCAFEAETAGREKDGPGGERALKRVKEAYKKFKARVEEILGETL